MVRTWISQAIVGQDILAINLQKSINFRVSFSAYCQGQATWGFLPQNDAFR